MQAFGRLVIDWFICHIEVDTHDGAITRRRPDDRSSIRCCAPAFGGFQKKRSACSGLGTRQESRLLNQFSRCAAKNL